MIQQNAILALANSLLLCTGSPQFIFSPFAKAIERGDRLVLVQQQNYQTYRNTVHSIFYPYKKRVLKRLRIEKAESVYFIERFNVEEGKIYGTAWCSTDSINYSFQFGALRFEEDRHVGNLPKQFKNWLTAECPTIELGVKPSVHSSSFIVQRYDRAGHYKFCFYSF